MHGGKAAHIKTYCRYRGCSSYTVEESLHCRPHTNRFGVGLPPVCPVCNMFARRDTKDGIHKRCRQSIPPVIKRCAICGKSLRAHNTTQRCTRCKKIERANCFRCGARISMGYFACVSCAQVPGYRDEYAKAKPAKKPKDAAVKT